MAPSPNSPDRPRLLFVGGFADRKGKVLGGQRFACTSLVASDLGRWVEFDLLDTTQLTHPPPPLWIRAAGAARRLVQYAYRMLFRRPQLTLIFASSGPSFVEKALMAWIAWVFGVPSVLAIVSGHFLDQVRPRGTFHRLAAILLRYPTRILCQGETWVQAYDELFGIPRERTITIFNWLDPTPFQDMGPRPAGRPPRILFVGWLEEKKGVFELVEAVSGHPDLQEVQVDLLGHGHAREKLETAIREAGIEDRFLLHGWKDGDEKLAFFRDADLLVLPTYAEGFPNVVLEAMAAGLPVVVSRVGAVPDVVQDGETGFLIEPKDVEGLGNALAKLVTDPERRRAMGVANQERCHREFTLEVAEERFRELFHELLSEAGTPAPGLEKGAR